MTPRWCGAPIRTEQRQPLRCPLPRQGAGSCPERSAATVRQEAGFVAGAEALTFGVLIFVIGTLLVVNLWAVVDARFAVAAAAREAVRAVVDAPAGSDPLAVAAAAAEVALVGHGIDPATARIDPLAPVVLARCAEVAIGVSVEVPALLLPGIERRSTAFTVTGEHREVVSPFRGGLEAGGSCGF